MDSLNACISSIAMCMYVTERMGKVKPPRGSQVPWIVFQLLSDSCSEEQVAALTPESFMLTWREQGWDNTHLHTIYTGYET